MFQDRACPNCRKVVFTYREILKIGYKDVVCRNCGYGIRHKLLPALLLAAIGIALLVVALNFLGRKYDMALLDLTYVFAMGILILSFLETLVPITAVPKQEDNRLTVIGLVLTVVFIIYFILTELL